MKKKILTKKVIINIEKDRERSEEFLRGIEEYLQANISRITGEEYSKIVMSAAKLVEASQKSNEQIVKMFEIFSKKKTPVKKSSELSSEEIEEIMKREDDVVES